MLPDFSTSPGGCSPPQPTKVICFHALCAFRPSNSSFVRDAHNPVLHCIDIQYTCDLVRAYWINERKVRALVKNLLPGMQALQPFLDPATAKKVLFITKENEVMQMPALFPMDKMEPCLGGSGTFTYDCDAYGRFCRDIESCMRGGLPPQLPPLENGSNDLESQQGRIEQLQLQQ